jgi:hypothetical protein
MINPDLRFSFLLEALPDGDSGNDTEQDGNN